MTYLEPGTYSSERCQSSTMKCFAKKFLYFRKMELSGSSIKKFLIFSQEKSFVIYQETKLCYISGNENPKKPSYIFSNESCYFPKRKRRKVLIFQETEFSYISQKVYSEP